MSKLNATLAGILVFEKGGAIVHFPDGSTHHHDPHTAFVRFKPDQLVNPPEGRPCKDARYRWIPIATTHTLVLNGIKETSVKYDDEVFGRSGAVRLDEICTNGPALMDVPHATLELTGGTLDVGARTEKRVGIPARPPGQKGQQGDQSETRKSYRPRGHS